MHDVQETISFWESIFDEFYVRVPPSVESLRKIRIVVDEQPCSKPSELHKCILIPHEHAAKIANPKALLDHPSGLLWRILLDIAQIQTAYDARTHHHLQDGMKYLLAGAVFEVITGVTPASVFPRFQNCSRKLLAAMAIVDTSGSQLQDDLTAFYVLHTLQRAFGWAAFRRVFRSYNDSVGATHNDENNDTVRHLPRAFAMGIRLSISAFCTSSCSRHD
eukprot:m.732309 g.732309  ORF g.732309 m.732309 type:complete len:219 (-) comp23067_c0_seq42:618-1274(-)